MRLVPTDVKYSYLLVARDPETDKEVCMGVFNTEIEQVNGGWDVDGYGIKDRRKDKADYTDDGHASKT